MPTPQPLIRSLGLRDYNEVLVEQRLFTDHRTAETPDELWFLEHPRVFTQGQAGKAEHVLFPGDIPVIQSDRGGQVTYHGPGQLVVYFLLDLQRLGYSIRELVTRLEHSLVATLADHSVTAYTDRTAPGVYVDCPDRAKIASLGLRVRKGCTYHGLSLNIDMDLEPFSRINPCGYGGLRMIQLKDLVPGIALENVMQGLQDHLLLHLGYASARKGSLQSSL